jgi:hypothetical protein
MIFDTLALTLDIVDRPGNSNLDFTKLLATLSTIKSHQNLPKLSLRSVHPKTTKTLASKVWVIRNPRTTPSIAMSNKLLRISKGCQVLGSLSNDPPFAFMGAMVASHISPIREQRKATAAQNALNATTLLHLSTVRIICDWGASLSCRGDETEFESLTHNQNDIAILEHQSSQSHLFIV